MKKKFGFLTLAVAFVAAFSSCSNENENGVTPVVEGEKASFSLTIATPKTYADANATTKEGTLYYADVFIVSGTNIAHTTIPGTGFTDVAGGKKINTPILTTTGAKTIYVGLNLPASAVAAIKTSTLTSITATVAELTNLAAMDKGFAMFSQNTAANKEFTVDKVQANNNFTITVERLTAKVTVAESPTYEVLAATKMDITELKFAMGQVNTKIYPLQNISDGVIKDTNWTFTTTTAPYFGDFVSEFGSNASINADAYVEVAEDGKTVFEKQVKYVLENTSDKHVQGELTYASIRAKFIPTKLCTYDGTTFKEEGNTALVAEMYVMETKSGNFFYFVDIDQAKAYRDQWVVDNGTGTASVTGPYKDSYCYYVYFLDAKNTKNTYATIRNIYYNMLINKIKYIGYPGPEVPDKDKEVGVPANIDITVGIENWTVVNSNEDMGQI